MTFPTRYLRRARIASMLAVTGILAAGASAQRVDPMAVEVANLREDVRMLAQRVGELTLAVEQLQRENSSLRNQAEARGQDYATLSQMNSAIAELRRTNNAALADQKRDIIAQVSQQIDQLGKQVQSALDGSRGGTAKSTFTAPVVFSDDFSKDAVAMHTVATGDTLSGIAKKYGASVRDIQNANRIADPTRLQVGQTLFIPKPKP